jgi:hypothetical protein
MIEIVFSDSACGSLKVAQNYGKGKYKSGAFGVCISNDDGSPVTDTQIEDARREYAEKGRLAWETATPMGGNSSDVYGFNLTLSVGNISEMTLGSERLEVIQQLCSVFPIDNMDQVSHEILDRAKMNLETVYSRASAGEDIRIWYSNQPDELCGVYWLMAQLNQMQEISGNVYLVKLPEWESNEQGLVRRKESWGEVAPGEWTQYLKLQELASPIVCKSFAMRWMTLQKENAPLRAMLNGQLVSVSETIYDRYIISEIAEEVDEFQEARIIGQVLGKYQLGISDYWVAIRIEEMIKDGRIEPVTMPEKDSPIYHRILKKRW